MRYRSKSPKMVAVPIIPIYPNSSIGDVEVTLYYQDPVYYDIISYDSIYFTVFKVELKNNTTEINENDIVYISNTPAMPSLKAKLKPDGLSGNADWELKIEFTRPNRNDNDTLTKTITANSEWNITTDFGTNFYGGKATLKGTYVGQSYTTIFHIRGTNPSESAAETEIGSSPRYAKAIARNESGTQASRTYLQFNESGTLGTNYLANLQKTTNRGGSAPYGWGIYQITQDPLPTRNQVWSWKANVAEGTRRISSNISEAPSYFAAIQRKYPTQYEAPPTSYRPPNTSTDLTYLEAAEIQMFNGCSVTEECPNPPPLTGNSWYRSCWKFHPNYSSGQRWEFKQNSNDYVKEIVQEYESHG